MQRAIVGRVLLRDRAYEVLRDAIVDGTLAPGEQLREGELQGWIGVSRTPIREAMMRLERAGLVHTRPGHSTTVVPLDDARIKDAVPVVAAMHALAARLATPRATSTHLDTMREANRAFGAALQEQDIDAALAADDQLHGVVVTLADNQALVDTLEQHSPLLRRAERARFSEPEAQSEAGLLNVSFNLHERLIAALQAGDAEAAAATALETWTGLRSDNVRTIH